MEFAINKINTIPVQTSEAVQKSNFVPGTSVEENHRNNPEQELSYNETKEITEKIQGHLDRMSISLRFSTYGKNNEKISVTVYEKDTGKVIREIPPEEFQRLNEKMEEVIGLIFNGNA